MRLRLSLAALALSTALSTGLVRPAHAATCDDPDPAVDLEARVADCEAILGGVYDRSTVPHLVFNLGRALRLLGRNDEALAPLQEALGYNPTSALYWAELARLSMAFGEPGTAAALFGEALKQEPGNIWLTGDRAEAWFTLGRSADCLSDLAAALPGMAGEQDQAWYYNLQGRCHAALGQQEQALAAYDAALGVFADYADAHGNRLYALAALGRYDEVIAATLTMTDSPALSDDWDIAARGMRLDALVFLGRGAEVPAELAALKARHPQGNADVVNLEAWYLFLSGDLQGANAAAQPLRDLYAAQDPALRGFMLDTLAQIDLGLGNTDLALDEFYTAAWLDPSLAAGWIAPLVAAGYLPQTRSADSVLLTLKNCIRAKGRDCDLRPRPAGDAPAPSIAAAPGSPASAAPAETPGPLPVPEPAQPAGGEETGTPAFEPAPGEGTPAAPVPAAPAPAPPALGAGPEPVRPDQPAEPASP